MNKFRYKMEEFFYLSSVYMFIKYFFDLYYIEYTYVVLL